MPLNYSFSQSFEKLADLWKSAEEKEDKKSEPYDELQKMIGLDAMNIIKL